MSVGNKKTRFSEASPEPVLSERVLEDIKLKCCFVTPMERARKIYEAIGAKKFASGTDFYAHLDDLKEFEFAPGCDYPLDSRSILHVPGWLREMACEVLFVNHVDRERTLPHLLLSTLAKAPVDLKRDLAANIVLLGGGFMIPGAKSRLADEIKALIADPSEPYASQLAFHRVGFHRPPAHDNYTAWLGGAIFATLDVLDLYSIHNNKFKEIQQLPDWFQLTPGPKSDMTSI